MDMTYDSKWRGQMYMLHGQRLKRIDKYWQQMDMSHVYVTWARLKDMSHEYVTWAMVNV